VNANQTNDNMSETPIMDEVARDCQYLSGPSNLWRHQDACAFYEKGQELERELTSAQQTIALLKEQCRVGDVAFQQLHCASRGKPVPDWVRKGLPKMYQTLETIAQKDGELQRLREACECGLKNTKLLRSVAPYTYIEDATAEEVFEQALSTPSPSAVVPWEVCHPFLEQVRDYLISGGLFNPEHMEHDKVQKMIMAHRDVLLSYAPKGNQ